MTFIKILGEYLNPAATVFFRICRNSFAFCSMSDFLATSANTPTMTKKEEQALIIFERKIFRRL
jgi:uncharacterized Fe-S radical SAM superfamily protein PflX